MAAPVLGERELDVMAVLWEIGSGTVDDVRAKLPSKLAYTTVLTILRNLEAKDFVTHEEEGRAYRYRARVAQQVAQKSAISRLVKKFFAGSPEALLAHLVDEHDVDAAELRRLARAMNKRRGSER